MRVRVHHDQIAPCLGDLPCATLERGPAESIDHLDQRGGAEHRVALLKHHGLSGLKVMRKEPIGAIEPPGSFTGMGPFLPGWAWMTQMLRVPSDHACLSDLRRPPLQERCRPQCGWLLRDNASVEVRSHGCEEGTQGSRVARFEQVHTPRKLCTHACFGPGFALGCAELSGFLQYLEEPLEWVVACHGLRTRLGCWFVLRQALVAV